MQTNQLAQLLMRSYVTAMAIGRARDVSARVGLGLLGALGYGAAYARSLRATREWRKLPA